MAYIDSELFEQELRRRAEGFCAVCSDYEHCIDEEIDRRGSHKYCWKPLQLPTADVAEVKHGKWKKESDVIGKPYMTCSVCKKNVFAISEYDYCPFCGAKMDGRSENHERSVVLGTIEPLQVHHGTPSFSTKEAAWEYLEQCRKEIEDER